VRTLQVYSRSRDIVYIFWLRPGQEREMFAAGGLRELLESRGITKYFVGGGDIKKLSLYHNVHCKSVVDIQRVACALVRDVIPTVRGDSVPGPSFGGNLMAVTAGVGRPRFEKCTQVCTTSLKKMGRMWDTGLKRWDKRERRYKFDINKLDYAAYDAFATYFAAERFRELQPTAGSLAEFGVNNW
jgi:hypothetical protein